MIEKIVLTNFRKFEKFSITLQKGSALQFAKETGSKVNATTIIEQESQKFEADWRLLDRRLTLAPGKETFARLNDILQLQYKISLTETKLIDQITLRSIDPEFLKVLKKLDQFCGE